jgi:hypothetical protein
MVAIALAALTLTACGRNDYYRRDTYPNGAAIDSGLAAAEHHAVVLLAHDNVEEILLTRTAPPWAGRMKRFLRSYAGRPTRLIAMSDAADATADESLLIRCRDGRRQRVGLAWAWFDGTWRAWPEYGFPMNGCGRS